MPGNLLRSLDELKDHVCNAIRAVKCSPKPEIRKEANHLVNECNVILKRVNEILCSDSDRVDNDSDDEVRFMSSPSSSTTSAPAPDSSSMRAETTNNRYYTKVDNSNSNNVSIDLTLDDSTSTNVNSENGKKPAKVVNCSVVESEEEDFNNFDFDDFMGTAAENHETTEENVSTLSNLSSASSTQKDHSKSALELYDDGLSDEEDNEMLLGMDENYDLDEMEYSDVKSDEVTLQEITIAEQKHLQREKDGAESNQPQDPKYINVLKRNFGYGKFRPLQWDIIKSVLEDRRDNFVVMSTGYGKSLTFQFPSVFTKRCSVIISPLISLMEDQALALQASSIEACVLGSSQKNTARVREEMFTGKYRLIYITPESAEHYLDSFLRLDKDVGIDLFAIDEAHCVSQWGNDFRPSYRKLDLLKKNFPKVPIIAATATATKRVQVDIIHNLRLRNPNITRTSFDRPNLFLCVKKKTNNAYEDIKELMKQRGLRYEFEGPTIIYCPTIKATETLKNVLDDMKVLSGMYHAKLSLKERQECHKGFLTDKIQVVVATVAFGMGIDKPDVRQVIHYGAPKEIETYYQEIGRAGRDGMPSICTVVYSEGDFFTIKNLINNAGSETFREHKYNMFQKMKQYLTTRDCRRRILLSHFEPGNIDDLGGFQDCCDCCKKRYLMEKSGVPETENDVDYSKEAKDFFKAVEVTGNLYGMTVPVMVLMGSVAKRVIRFKDAVCHGVGKSRSEKFWKTLGHCLLDAGYLKEERLSNCFGDSIKMTDKALAWMRKYNAKPDEVKIDISISDDLIAADNNLRKKASFLLAESQQAAKVGASQLPQFTLAPYTRPMAATSSSSSSSSSNSIPPPPPVDPRVASLEKDLYLKLLKVRDEIFKETGFTPHSIASNKMLLDMAKIRPSSPNKLLQLEDFSHVKVERFGQKFTSLINSFCKDNSLNVDNFPETNPDKEWKENVDLKTKVYALTTTQQESYQMFMLGHNTLDDVANKRGLKTSTIVTHLCEAILVGLDVDIHRLGVSQHHKDLITRTIWAAPINGDISSLTSIKDRLPPNVEYNHVKIVISQLTQQYGKEMNADGKWALQRPKNEAVVLPIPPSPSQPLKRSGSDISPCADMSPPMNKIPKSASSPPYVSSSNSSQSQNCSQTAKQSASQQTAMSTQSQSQLKRSGSTDSSSRSLPSWMQAAASKNVFKKKIKSNSLFK